MNAAVGETEFVTTMGLDAEVSGIVSGLDVFLGEFDGFVGRLIDQLAPAPMSVPAGAVVSAGAPMPDSGCGAAGAGAGRAGPPGAEPGLSGDGLDYAGVASAGDGARGDGAYGDSARGDGAYGGGAGGGGAGGRTLFDLLDAPRGVVDEPRLLMVLKAGVAVRNLVDHLLAAAAAAAERSGVVARRHRRTGADLLTDLGMAPGPAYRLARVGRAAPQLPALTRASRLGGVGIEFADALGKGITHIQARIELTDDEVAEILRALMLQCTPAEVNKKARGIAIARTRAQRAADSSAEDTDTDRPPVVPVAENADLNAMTLTQNDEGRVTATLDLDVLTGEELFAALDPLCRPVPAPDGSRDPRPPTRRRADAMGQVIRDYLAGYNRPTSGGILPHVSLIRPVPAALGPHPPSGSSQEFVDTLGFTGPISPATADLVACDSTVEAIGVDGNGAPLDVGRSQRLFPPHIRRALIARDRGCAFPGCGAHPSWCDGHHIRHWTAWGVTSLDNGVLLCRRHHRAIHHDGWQVYLGTDRHPWFIPPVDPAHPDRPREHLRSHARRTLNLLPNAA